MQANLKLIIPPEEIHLIVDRVAREIRADYASKNPLLIGVLKGALVFLSDLIRALKIPLEVDFIQTSCYGKRDSPKEEIEIVRDATTELKGRDIIIVEGIVDRGLTASAVIDYLKRYGPSSVKCCTLLLRSGKASSRAEVNYVGARVDEGFIVGYGLDYKEHYRGLPALYIMPEAK